jgi:uncharacterized membrane protein
MENNVQQKNDPQKIPTTIFSQVYSSPLPPPEALAKYEQINSELLPKIVELTEAQGNHRRELEINEFSEKVRIQKRRDNETNLGQIFAFIITMSAILGAIYIASKGYQTAAGFISSFVLLNLITAFIKGRHKEDK